ncbi:MAG TPA: ATP-grasp domain-containing protein [Pseudonocardiaceae bacterium]|nr:ATP-grasp domain-containing protein [Pseudonocardiaceae bacterium]
MDRQILILFGSRACAAADPILAAQRVGCTATVLSPAGDGCATMADGSVHIQLGDPASVVELARRLHATTPVAAVVSYEEEVTPLAARIAAALGLPAHPVDAAEAALDKPAMKQRLAAAGVPIADHVLAIDEDDAVGWAARVGYPVVVKPCRGSASQGVIRADDEPELRAAYRRVRRIVRDYGLDTGGRPNATQLVEKYLDGGEISVELLLQHGRTQVSAVFDKPEPLTGPFFEETIYLTPPRLDPALLKEVEDLAVRAAAALGLWHGPAHCEIRLTSDGPVVLEIAARLLGGPCSRVFSDRLGVDFHALLMRLAMGDPVELPEVGPDAPVAAAMMLPVPGEGRVVAVHGAEQARGVPGIRMVDIVAVPGDVIVSFPEPMCYSVGFVIATGATHQEVEESLAKASANITLELEPIGCDRWVRPVEPADADYRPPLPPLPVDREFVVSVLADSMFGELPHAAAIASAACAVECDEAARGVPAWVALGDGERRAVSVGFVDGTTGYMGCFGVPPEYRQAGLGEAVLRGQLAEFARRGCTLAVSETDPRLPLSPAALRRVGFTLAGSDDGSACRTC